MSKYKLTTSFIIKGLKELNAAIDRIYYPAPQIEDAIKLIEKLDKQNRRWHQRLIEAEQVIDELRAEIKAVAEACNASGGEFWWATDSKDFDYKTLPTFLKLRESK